MGVGPIPSSAIARAGPDDPDELVSFRGAIRAMDAVYLEHANPSDGKPKQKVETRQLSPALFDALFG